MDNVLNAFLDDTGYSEIFMVFIVSFNDELIIIKNMLKEVTKEIGITQRHWHFVTNET
jgi:hypothetical protein